MSEDIKASLHRSLGIGQVEILEGWVDSVDEGKCTASIRIEGDDEDSLVLPDVALRSIADDDINGIVLIPEVDSYVLFARIEGQDNYVLLKTSKIEKVLIDIKELLKATIPNIEIEGKEIKMVIDNVNIESKDIKIKADKTTFNDGSNLGLAKVLAIGKQLNLIEADITVLKAAFAAWLPAVGDMGEGLRAASTAWAAKPLTPTVATDLANDKITH